MFKSKLRKWGQTASRLTRRGRQPVAPPAVRPRAGQSAPVAHASAAAGITGDRVQSRAILAADDDTKAWTTSHHTASQIS
jgi:hypothetical protein